MNEGSLHGAKIAFLAADGVQEQELGEPWDAVLRAGGEPVLVSIKKGEIQATRGGEKTKKFTVDKLVGQVSYKDFSGLVIPGGLKSPDLLRMDENAVEFVRGFVNHDMPVASICHGPWMLVEADVVRGRTLTSYPSLKTDLKNAGAEWVDKKVNVDQKLVTSRNPNDLPAFCDAMVMSMINAIEERSLDQAVEQTFPASDPLPGP